MINAVGVLYSEISWTTCQSNAFLQSHPITQQYLSVSQIASQVTQASSEAKLPSGEQVR